MVVGNLPMDIFFVHMLPCLDLADAVCLYKALGDSIQQPEKRRIYNWIEKTHQMTRNRLDVMFQQKRVWFRKHVVNRSFEKYHNLAYFYMAYSDTFEKEFVDTDQTPPEEDLYDPDPLSCGPSSYRQMTRINMMIEEEISSEEDCENDRLSCLFRKL